MKIAMFDFFGTLFQAGSVSANVRRYYSDVLKSNHWRPLEFPESMFSLPVFCDVGLSLAALRSKGYTIASCTNFPVHQQIRLCQNAGIRMDVYVPLELRQVYKPNPAAYKVIMDMLRVVPSEITMVTANKSFGDLEATSALGMHCVLIRDPSSLYKTLLDWTRILP